MEHHPSADDDGGTHDGTFPLCCACGCFGELYLAFEVEVWMQMLYSCGGESVHACHGGDGGHASRLGRFSAEKCRQVRVGHVHAPVEKPEQAAAHLYGRERLTCTNRLHGFGREVCVLEQLREPARHLARTQVHGGPPGLSVVMFLRVEAN